MLAKNYLDYKHKIAFPCIVQPKIDGLRCTSQSNGLFTRNGNAITNMSHIKVNSVHPFDGELYEKGKNFEYINGIVRRSVNMQKNDIKYYVFDYCCSLNFRERYDCLVDAVSKADNENIVIVPSFLVYSHAGIEAYLDAFIADGYEGVMIRDIHTPYQQKRTVQLLKYKKWLYSKLTIIGFVEGTGKYVGMLGAIICKTCEGKVVNVGSGFDDTERHALWRDTIKDSLIGTQLIVKYQELTKFRIPRFPTYVKYYTGPITKIER